MSSKKVEWYTVCDEDPWLRTGKFYETYLGTQSMLDGKYLFFSKDKKKLISLIEDEILNHGFNTAKIINEPKGIDYVACLFWTGDERKYELADRYKGSSDIKYRYYKSNADTMAGKYSKQFIEETKQ
jgi:hypothetical protein